MKNILDHEEKAVTIEIIQKFVADYYNLKMVDLKSRNNSKSVAMPRQIAMYLCKSLTHASLPEIGRSFGGKHHSTVIHSIRKVEDLRKKDVDFNTLIGNFPRRFPVGVALFPQPADRPSLCKIGSRQNPCRSNDRKGCFGAHFLHKLNCSKTSTNGLSCTFQHTLSSYILSYSRISPLL